MSSSRSQTPSSTNEADTWATLSDIAVLAGRVEEGLEHIRKAFRLNPFPASWYYLTLGQAQYAAGEYEAAVETLRRDETYRTSSRRFLAASLAQLGRLDEARAEVELFLVGNPHFTTRHWATTEPFRDAATLEHFVDGYRKAVFRSDIAKRLSKPRKTLLAGRTVHRYRSGSARGSRAGARTSNAGEERSESGRIGGSSR